MRTRTFLLSHTLLAKPVNSFEGTLTPWYKYLLGGSRLRPLAFRPRVSQLHDLVCATSVGRFCLSYWPAIRGPAFYVAGEQQALKNFLHLLDGWFMFKAGLPVREKEWDEQAAKRCAF